MITLEKNEMILYTARKHWFVFVSESIFLLTTAIMPIGIFFLIGRATNVTFSLKTEEILAFCYSLWLLLLWLVVVYIWTDYYLDVWHVTNTRVIDIDQRGLFNREISSLRLEMIQDATIQVPGILATLVGFGNIHVQTAGQSQSFIMKGVRYPHGLKEAIVKAQSAIRNQSAHGVVFEEDEPSR